MMERPKPRMPRKTLEEEEIGERKKMLMGAKQGEMEKEVDKRKLAFKIKQRN